MYNFIKTFFYNKKIRSVEHNGLRNTVLVDLEPSILDFITSNPWEKCFKRDNFAFGLILLEIGN